MIRLSRLADYAIVLMCEMATSLDETFSARKLHETTQISQSAIMKILKLLAGAGLVTSVRGSRGGYNIASDPKEISISDIVKVIDGPISVTLCSYNNTDESCVFEAHCMAKTGWGMVNNALKDTLSRFSVADFITSHAVHHNKNKGGYYDDIAQ
jgi:FeS assembly SUF system regulator